MKRLFATVILLTMVVAGIASAQTTINYGALTLNPGYSATNFSEVWDLTQGDLVLSYTIDMTGIVQPGPWQTSYTEVGLRQIGASNFNPGPWNTYQGGAGGWLTSLVGDLTPNPNNQNLHDKHNLSASGGRGELDYDATAPGTVVSPIGSYANYGIWFDRDGVDQWQAQGWGAVDGGTYNTGGVYDVVITYHAINSGLGTMFVTLNGIATGFFTPNWHAGAPDYFPAGLSFKGDMAKMQVFAGLWAPSSSYGPVALSDLEVNGYLSLVHNFVFVANEYIEITRSKFSSQGNMFCNGNIYFTRGDPTTYAGNLTAVGCITIDKENLIDGDVTAGGAIKLDPAAGITGAVNAYAGVAPLNLPNPYFTAGGPSYTVPTGGSLTLPPGSYGNVYVREKGTLNLSSGTYRFNRLETKDEATTLNLDVTNGSVAIKVVTNLRFNPETTSNILPSGEAGTTSVTFTTRQSTQMVIAKECYLLGTIIAPNACVLVGKNTSFKGSLIADKIYVERDVTLLHHYSSGSLPVPKPVLAQDMAAGTVTSYELAQNYPNPFNPSTTIRFALPQAGELSLAIYNTAGQLVRLLAKGEYAAGRHAFVWDGRDESGQRVASGVYVYVLKAGSFVAERKLVLMK